MRIPQDERFRDEAARYDLKWNCEDCALADGEGGCVHGFPTARHLAARYEDPTADVLFCKEFLLR